MINANRTHVSLSSSRMMKLRVTYLTLSLTLCCCFMLVASDARAQGMAASIESRPNIAVLDFGATETGHRAADELSSALANTLKFRLVNRAQSRAAARGVEYTGSLNLTLAAARDLGAAIGCDLYFTGDAQTLRRTSGAGLDYFESYASIFLVSAYSGRLLLWEQLNREARTPVEAEKALLAELRARASHYGEAVFKAQEAERAARLATREQAADAFAELPEEGSAAAKNFRAPLPYRSLRPLYPKTAARMEAEATVDALVGVDAAGKVKDIEIVRWAGYGLNEAVIATVRQLHFRPALRDGQPVPIRVLLRYNFRRPARESER